MANDDRQTPDIDLAADTAALEGARNRRHALGDAADLIEDLIARPGSDPRWTMRVADSLQGLTHAFAQHVAEVEHEGGLLPQLRDDAPRLSNAIDGMHREHHEIDDELAAVTRLVQDCGGDCGSDLVEAIREAVVNVLRSISLHRQRGADLVYEAYSVDIGGG